MVQRKCLRLSEVCVCVCECVLKPKIWPRQTKQPPQIDLRSRAVIGFDSLASTRMIMPSTHFLPSVSTVNVST